MIYMYEYHIYTKKNTKLSRGARALKLTDNERTHHVPACMRNHSIQQAKTIHSTSSHICRGVLSTSYCQHSSHYTIVHNNTYIEPSNAHRIHNNNSRNTSTTNEFSAIFQKHASDIVVVPTTIVYSCDSTTTTAEIYMTLSTRLYVVAADWVEHKIVHK